MNDYNKIAEQVLMSGGYSDMDYDELVDLCQQFADEEEDPFDLADEVLRSMKHLTGGEL